MVALVQVETPKVANPSLAGAEPGEEQSEGEDLLMKK